MRFSFVNKFEKVEKNFSKPIDSGGLGCYTNANKLRNLNRPNESEVAKMTKISVKGYKKGIVKQDVREFEESYNPDNLLSAFRHAVHAEHELSKVSILRCDIRLYKSVMNKTTYIVEMVCEGYSTIFYKIRFLINQDGKIDARKERINGYWARTWEMTRYVAQNNQLSTFLDIIEYFDKRKR